MRQRHPDSDQQPHNDHPGGRSFETFPVNANEAEGRRLARFRQHGHTAGTMDVTVESPHPDHPYSLDLRVPAHGNAI